MTEQLDRREWLSRFGLLALLPAGLDPSGYSKQRESGATPLSSPAIYHLRNFGAAGDGKTDDTAALQRAIDSCTANGGGVVYVPAGTFVVGTTELKDNVTLHLAPNAVIQGSGNGQHYRPVEQVPLTGDTTLEDGNYALLYAVSAKNITIEGRGVIDGNGAFFHRPAGGPPALSGLDGERRPYHVLFYRCMNVQISHVRFRNSAYHSIRLIQSEHINIDSVHIDSRVTFNNDGFHLISCSFVTISNCIVLCKDDACAMFGSCSNILVTNSFFRTRWSVFRFGGGNVRNISVSNCILSQVYGCPIKLQGNPGSSYTNLSFSDIILDDVTGPIHIGAGPDVIWDGSVEGKPEPAKDVVSPDGTIASPAVVSDISFSNIRGTVNTAPPKQSGDVVFPGEGHSCIVLNCVEGAVIENVSFNSVHLTFSGGGTRKEGEQREMPHFAGEYFMLGPTPAYGLYARAVRGLSMTDVSFRLAKPDARPAVVLDQVVDAKSVGLSVAGDVRAESTLRLIDCKDIYLSTTRLLTDAHTFLVVNGAANLSIILDGVDLRRAQKPVAFSEQAAELQTSLRPI